MFVSMLSAFVYSLKHGDLSAWRYLSEIRYGPRGKSLEYFAYEIPCFFFIISKGFLPNSYEISIVISDRDFQGFLTCDLSLHMDY